MIHKQNDLRGAASPQSLVVIISTLSSEWCMTCHHHRQQPLLETSSSVRTALVPSKNPAPRQDAPLWANFSNGSREAVKKLCMTSLHTAYSYFSQRCLLSAPNLRQRQCRDSSPPNKASSAGKVTFDALVSRIAKQRLKSIWTESSQISRLRCTAGIRVV
jgi:hypothetical protein